MAHHHGVRKKTRDKLSKHHRARGLSPIMRAIQEFEIGSKVHIQIDPSIHKGMPHPRFHGKTGEVVGTRGRAYILKVSDGRATKIIIALPEHLKGQQLELDTKILDLYSSALLKIHKEDRIKFTGFILDSIYNDLQSEKKGRRKFSIDIEIRPNDEGNKEGRS